MIEMRDGWLLLRPVMDPPVLSYARALVAAAALPEPEARAVVDAAVLAIALRRHPHHRRPLTKITPLAQSEGADLPDEVAALERVAHCYQHSPIVRALAARFGTD